MEPTYCPAPERQELKDKINNLQTKIDISVKALEELNKAPSMKIAYPRLNCLIINTLKRIKGEQ